MGFCRTSFTIPALIVVLFLSACTADRESASVMPGNDLSRLRSFVVEPYPEEKRSVEQLIVNELRRLGYKAELGSPEHIQADALVTFRSKWFWDITMYLLELDIQLREPKSRFPIATANSFHASLTRRSAEEMVREVLGNLFRAGEGKSK